MALPDVQGSGIVLINPTFEEILDQQKKNSVEWKGALSLEAYLRREQVLIKEALVSDGGLTPWALVHNHDAGRTVLASCETLRKKAIVANHGQIRDVISHGVASVFCPPEQRGRGYAGRMVQELGEKLQKWQADEMECLFSVLYSDIGKEFYAAKGWLPFPSAHISIAPTTESPTPQGLPPVRPLHASDIAELCLVDAKMLRERVAQRSLGGKAAVAIIPDVETFRWHHTREDFVGQELHGKTPVVKGAMVQDAAGKRTWCIWTRMWYNSNPEEAKGNVLHILRLVHEDASDGDEAAASEEGANAAQGSHAAASVAALLVVAQAEAGKWGMGEVDIWNPTSCTLAAARMLDSSAQVVHREKESIASLRWYGEKADEQVEWMSNEKYAWC